MKEIKISLDETKLEKIEEYISEKRFNDLNDFFNKAVKLLLYAEDKKDEFNMILPKNASTKKP